MRWGSAFQSLAHDTFCSTATSHYLAGILLTDACISSWIVALLSFPLRCSVVLCYYQSQPFHASPCPPSLNSRYCRTSLVRIIVNSSFRLLMGNFNMLFFPHRAMLLRLPGRPNSFLRNLLTRGACRSVNSALAALSPQHQPDASDGLLHRCYTSGKSSLEKGRLFQKILGL